jgi:quercetin dioxygenase-like cupin family protein
MPIPRLANIVAGKASMKEQDATAIKDFIKQYDLMSEISAFESRKPWQQGLTSKLLLKSSDFRLMLIAMQNGAKMQEHHSDGRISIQALRGRIRVHVGDRVVELTSGHLLALDRSIKHDVEALEDSAFLLTIAWPADPELIALKHRGYGS